LTGDETCVTLTSEKTQPVGNVQMAPVRMYSYYDPGVFHFLLSAHSSVDFVVHLLVQPAVMLT